MDANSKYELSLIKQELQGIINELYSISGGVRRDFSGIGNEQCSNAINNIAKEYELLKKKLEKMDLSAVTEEFAVKQRAAQEAARKKAAQNNKTKSTKSSTSTKQTTAKTTSSITASKTSLSKKTTTNKKNTSSKKSTKKTNKKKDKNIVEEVIDWLF